MPGFWTYLTLVIRGQSVTQGSIGRDAPRYPWGPRLQKRQISNYSIINFLFLVQPKEKQKEARNNLQQRKRKALASLFKEIRQIGKCSFPLVPNVVTLVFLPTH